MLFDLLIEEGGSVPTVYDHHTEKDMNLALVQPWCSIGSDGPALAVEGPLRRGNPHPRSFGTFPRVLGVYVRDLGLLRLEDAVRKMTSLSATKLGITDRGLLRPGNYADVTVFDPERIADRRPTRSRFSTARASSTWWSTASWSWTAASTRGSGRGGRTGMGCDRQRFSVEWREAVPRRIRHAGVARRSGARRSL